ncbi:hypothetical protein EMIT0111MI5_10076 [Burkholderia sp. IT-111MI5]
MGRLHDAGDAAALLDGRDLARRARAGRVADHGLHRVRLSADVDILVPAADARAQQRRHPDPRRRHRGRRPLTADRPAPARRHVAAPAV